MTSFKTFLFSAVISSALLVPAVAMAQDPAASAPPAEKTVAKETRAAHAFAEADTNKDGALDLEEFLTRHREKFKEIDSNSDGQISTDEMKAHGEKMRAKMKEHAEKRGKAQAPASETPAE